jgi:hypothetical protein
VIGPLLGWSAAAGGVILLRLGWGLSQPGLGALGGIVLAAGAFGWALEGDSAIDKAVALTLLVPSLAVIPVLLRDASWRPRRPPRTREATPAEPRGRIAWGRGALRVLCAGPLSAAAAIGIGALLAVKAPWEEADRFIAGTFLATLLWALAGVWSTTDRRLGLVTGALIGSAALSCMLAAW